MKVNFLNAQRRFGVSAKTGNKYDICELEYAVPLEDKKTDNYTFRAFGHQSRKIELLADGMADFEAVRLGQEIDLALEPDATRPQFNICTGLVKGK